MNYKTLINKRLGRLRIVIDRDWSYWSVGIAVGTGCYVRLDVGPVGFSIMKSN